MFGVHWESEGRADKLVGVGVTVLWFVGWASVVTGVIALVF